jgi:two-component system response regulator NreC
MATRVLLCDDHILVRSGIRRLLTPEEWIEVVGEAANAVDAVEQARNLQPDVLLLDIAMPGPSGLTVISDLRSASPSTRILILSMQDDPSYVRRAFDAGAHGYLLKEAADLELLQAMRDVVAGHRYLHASLEARLAVQTVLRPGERREELSRREREILQLLALGHTNPEIAKVFVVSVGTIEAHRSRIMERLHLSTRAELIRYVLESRQLQVERRAQSV